VCVVPLSKHEGRSSGVECTRPSEGRTQDGSSPHVSQTCTGAPHTVRTLCSFVPLCPLCVVVRLPPSFLLSPSSSFAALCFALLCFCGRCCAALSLGNRLFALSPFTAHTASSNSSERTDTRRKNLTRYSVYAPRPRLVPLMSRLLQRGCLSLAQLRASMRHVPAKAQQQQQGVWAAVCSAAAAATAGASTSASSSRALSFSAASASAAASFLGAGVLTRTPQSQPTAGGMTNMQQQARSVRRMPRRTFPSFLRCRRGALFFLTTSARRLFLLFVRP
jgi:hypothetical protein